MNPWRFARYLAMKPDLRGDTVLIADGQFRDYVVEEACSPRHRGEFSLLYLDDDSGLPATITCLNQTFPLFHPSVEAAKLWILLIEATWDDSQN